jgi:hypothetical protein
MCYQSSLPKLIHHYVSNQIYNIKASYVSNQICQNESIIMLAIKPTKIKYVGKQIYHNQDVTIVFTCVIYTPLPFLYCYSAFTGIAVKVPILSHHTAFKLATKARFKRWLKTQSLFKVYSKTSIHRFCRGSEKETIDAGAIVEIEFAQGP